MLTDKEVFEKLKAYDRKRRFGGVVFPTVRRVFSSLIASEIVNVQPMTLPTGLDSFFNFTYGKDKEKENS